MQAQEVKENFSQYFIKAFTTDQQVIEATITFYREDRGNSTVLLDMFSKDETFTYMGGKVKVFVMTYQDTLNHHYKMVSDEVRSLFPSQAFRTAGHKTIDTRGKASLLYDSAFQTEFSSGKVSFREKV